MLRGPLHRHHLLLCQVPLINLVYAPDSPSDVIVDEEIENENGSSKSISVRPTTVMLTYGRHRICNLMPAFESPAHVVDVIDHFFGKYAERIVLDSWFASQESLKAIYRPQGKKRSDYHSCKLRAVLHCQTTPTPLPRNATLTHS